MLKVFVDAGHPAFCFLYFFKQDFWQRKGLKEGSEA